MERFCRALLVVLRFMVKQFWSGELLEHCLTLSSSTGAADAFILQLIQCTFMVCDNFINYNQIMVKL